MLNKCICFSENNSQHEQPALEMTSKIIFERTEDVRHKSLVIHKSCVEYISLKYVIEINSYCWEMLNGKISTTNNLLDFAMLVPSEVGLGWS